MDCININSVEFQTLLNRSGLSEFALKVISRGTLNKFGRFPHLDELPGVNSEKALKEVLSIKKDGSAKIDTVLEQTGTDTIENATIFINKEYRDLEVSTLPLSEEVIIDIQHRPNRHKLSEVKEIMVDDKVNSQLFISQSLNKLQNLYGIKIIPITIDEIINSDLGNKIPNASITKAFIYEGNVYINVDTASVDSPIHEMMHLFVGSLRFTNPKLYTSLLQKVNNLNFTPEMLTQFPGRTRNDILEEILVTEVSKHLTGQDSYLDTLTPAELEEINYNVTRMIDSVLFGDNSSNHVDKKQLPMLSLKNLAKMLNSAAMNNNFQGTMDDAAIHRVLSNVKSDLIKQGKLEEFC